MKQACALIAGVIFGLGLILSGMANPAKVLNFLDIVGTWDPSLAFVMGGAVLVTAPGFALLRRMRDKPIFAETFQFPTKSDIDPKLLIGAVMFGVGWGLGGFCPGPALTSVPIAAFGTLAFVLCMLGGIWIARNAPELSKPSLRHLG